MVWKARLLAVVLCVINVGVILALEPNGTQCNGQHQSPINIDQYVESNMPDLDFSAGFFDKRNTQIVYSDKHTVVIITKTASPPVISGGPLNVSYNLHSIHFHWSNQDNVGSEHTFKGKSYVMEMHCVFTREGIPFEQAKTTPEGLAVIAYFMDISKSKYISINTPFKVLAQSIAKIQTVDTPVNVVNPFYLAKLIVPFQTNYFTYSGSLTTGNCEEVVIWIVSRKLLKITPKQIQSFRDLYTRKLVTDAANYRSVKALNSRVVKHVTAVQVAKLQTQKLLG